MKQTFLFLLIGLLAGTMFAQRQMETLDRGLVAMKTDKGVYTSWRIPGDEYYGVKYNLYRNGSLVAEGLDVSNYQDASGTTSDTYAVAPVVNGVVGQQCAAQKVWNANYLEFPLAKVINPKNGKDVTHCFGIGDGAIADLDGDGQYELIVKRQNTDFTLANDSAYTRFEAYEFDGTKLWEVNLGPNMRDGNGSENACYAFDFDEDGKAEVIFRGADGTILPDGTVVGNKTVNYRSGFTGNQCYMIDGNEYVVMLDGATGKTLDTQIFDSKCGTYNTSTNNAGNPASGVYQPGTSAPGNNLARRSEAFWYGGNTKGDGGHRATKFFFGAPYLDGRHPFVYIGRGAYTNYHAATWRVVDKKLKLHWACAVDDWTSPFYGQGYHNFTIADVDMDGRDEICHGNMVVDENGKFHSSTSLGHGDAQHYGDLDPFRDGLEGFRCLEDNPGAVFVDANTSEVLFRWKRGNDCGRAMAGNFTDKFPGAQLWTVDGNLWSASTTRNSDDRVASEAPGITMNARIYWDGDILEEAFDYKSLSNYQGYDVNIYKYGSYTPVFQTSGALTINGSKGNPVAQADIFGDWREELVLPTSDNRSIRIYTTTFETKFRNYTLMHDPQYRQAVYWQSSGYNQPPHVSYFLGNLEGIVLPPPPAVTNGKSDLGTVLSSATDGKFVIGCESAATAVTVSGTVSPAYLQINSDADYTLNGGTFVGNTVILKQGPGNLTLADGTYNQTGNTEVWYGSMTVNCNYASSPVVMKRFSQLNSNANVANVSMEYGAKLNPSGAGAIGAMTVGKLDMQGGAIINFDFQSDGSAFDVLTVDSLVLGAANCIGATPVFNVNRLQASKLAAGQYIIMNVKKGIQGDLSKVTVSGLNGQLFSLKQVDNTIVLVVEDMRVATEIVIKSSGTWDLSKTESFYIDNVPTSFVTGDAVIIDATTSNIAITVSEDVQPASITVIGGKTVNIQGTGKIGGSGKLIMKGTGVLNIKNTNELTGDVEIWSGAIAISKFADLQNSGSLGKLYSTGTTLRRIYIDREASLRTTAKGELEANITIGDSAVIQNNYDLTLKGSMSGKRLIKNGSGALSWGYNPNIRRADLNSGVWNVDYCTGKSCMADTMVLNAGTLNFTSGSLYQSCNNIWVVPEGKSATVDGSNTLACASTLLGAGTLTYLWHNVSGTPREYLEGNWSKFTGTVNFTGYDLGRPIRLCNTLGLANATVNLSTEATSLSIGGDPDSKKSHGAVTGTFKIGELTGKGSLVDGYDASSQFQVGFLNADFEFAGNVNTNFVKVGSGELQMKYNTGSGNIIIREGTFLVNGGKFTSNSSYTSASGTGSITLESGTTTMASGCMGNSSVTVKRGATFQPGVYYSGSLAICCTPEFEAGSVLQFRVSIQKDSKGNRKGAICNYFTGTSNFSNNATIQVIQNKNYEPISGDRISLWFTRLYYSTSSPKLELFDLPDSLMWNTDSLNTNLGLLKVVRNPDFVDALDEVKASGYEQGVYYNLLGQPAAVLRRGQVYILNGKKIVW